MYDNCEFCNFSAINFAHTYLLFDIEFNYIPIVTFTAVVLTITQSLNTCEVLVFNLILTVVVLYMVHLSQLIPGHNLDHANY